jgi:hypothetical protein
MHYWSSNFLPRSIELESAINVGLVGSVLTALFLSSAGIVPIWAGFLVGALASALSITLAFRSPINTHGLEG